MGSISQAVRQTERITFQQLISDTGSVTGTLAQDVREGLGKPFKELPPKHFYDARGSELFEQICGLPEYYPTRTERAILAENAWDIAASTGAKELVELGAGSAAKTVLLLDAMNDSKLLERYVPIDVSVSAMQGTAAMLAGDYSELEVHCLVGDFECHLEHIPDSENPRIFMILGGTVGNFVPERRVQLLSAIRSSMADGDHLLIGTDLVKNHKTIEAAYDDSAGITAEFNRNVLHVINRELGGNFEPDNFDHIAFFNRDREWVEMRLRSRQDCKVRIEQLDMEVAFTAGEELRTEISAKFTRKRIQQEYASANLKLKDWYTDRESLFALSLAQPV